MRSCRPTSAIRRTASKGMVEPVRSARRRPPVRPTRGGRGTWHRRRERDVGMAIQWNTRGADPVHRRDDRLPHPVVPGGEVKIEVFARLGDRSKPRPSDAISIMSAPVWNALPFPVWTITRTAGSASGSLHASGEFVAHGIVHCVEAFGAIVDRPANRAVGARASEFHTPLRVLLVRAHVIRVGRGAGVMVAHCGSLFRQRPAGTSTWSG